MNELQDQWDASYQRRENFVFAPQEELVRFISKYVRKRIGLDQFQDVMAGPVRLLDLGCGIGRHVVFAHEMGLEAYGVDLSPVAVETARQWAARVGVADVTGQICIASATQLPWADGFFDVVVSHGVLDSMSFEIARIATSQAARVLKPGGLFYCDLVSGDDSAHGPEFDGEEIVNTPHERDTIQSYFNFAKIQRLIGNNFKIIEAVRARRIDLLRPVVTARTHLALRRTE